MSEPASKRAKTEEVYELYYWGGLPGRGEPIRLAFEETGVDYVDVGNVPGRGSKEVIAMFQNATGTNPPHFAPPMLKHGDLVISQLPNILLYLGPRLGLVPETEAGKFRVNQLTLTACDLQNEAHDTHHPVAASLYYEDQKEEALKKAKDFRETRIPKFLKHFEAVLTHGGGEWLVENQLTYADLMLCYVIDGLKFAFPKAMAQQEPNFPKVFALYKIVQERPRIDAYMKSDRRMPFKDGIYRHYEALDAA